MVPSCSRLSYFNKIFKYSHIKIQEINPRYRGDITETYKTLHGIYDTTVSPCLPRSQFSPTRGNNFELVKHHCRYDIQKYSFTQSY